jgi:hypothetical protein
MAKKRVPRKTVKAARTSPPETIGIDSAVGHAARGAFEIAEAITKAAEELKAPYDFHDGVNESLGSIGGATRSLSMAVAAAVIAQYGTNDDRREAVAYLKGWFDSSVFSTK